MVQRLACLSITGAMRTAPTRAVEVWLNLMKLDIFIKMEAVRAAYMLHTMNHLQAGSYGHPRGFNWASDRMSLILKPLGFLRVVISGREN